MKLRKKSAYGLKYHIRYNNGYKPPLDISFNNIDGSVDCIKYIIQDERIFFDDINYDIIDSDSIFDIPYFIDEINYICNRQGEFVVYFNDSNLFIIKKDISLYNFMGYSIDINTMLLFQEKDFCGILIKDINENEMEELRKSKCI